MGERTGIEWATFTASPWFGCSRVSAGCVNCYAEALTLQKGWAGWGDNSPRVRSKGFWKDAYRYNRAAAKSISDARDRCPMELADPALHMERPRMFTSLMDWLDPMAPIELLAEFLRVIHDCRNLDWLLLTKRPELFQSRMGSVCDWIGCEIRRLNHREEWHEWVGHWTIGTAPPHVWFGVTVENQAMADKRLPILTRIPARVRWLSVEPILEHVSLQEQRNGISYNWLKDFKGTTFDGRAVDWVVVGGESGAKRRDCGVEAIVNVAEQCVAAGVPIFVKQDVGRFPGTQGRIPNEIWALKQYPRSEDC